MQTPDRDFDPAALEQLGRSLNAWIDAGRIPGAVVWIERHGRVGLHAAFGAQDPVRQVAMQRDSIFRIYSMTKPIVSVALMQLAEQGRVLLRHPVARYLPEFAATTVGLAGAAQTRPMTIQDLLRHTAGLTYEFLPPSPERARYAEARLHARDVTLAEQVRVLAGLPLMHQPGTVWDYSRATDVLGRVVEVLADRPLGEHLQDAIFEPLGMHDTGFRVLPSEHGRLAEPFADPPEGVPLVPVYDPRRPSLLEGGGGGLLSTAADYARFLRLMLGGGRSGAVRLLGRKTVEYMTADHLGPIPQDHAFLPAGHGFGLGFAVRTALGESTEPGSIGSYGWSGAAGTAFFVDPAESLFGIVLTQAPGLLDEVRESFRQSVYAAVE